jgi:hypothetical protein
MEPADAVNAAELEAYPWVDGTGEPFCDLALTHKPEVAEAETDVWVVIDEDRHGNLAVVDGGRYVGSLHLRYGEGPTTRKSRLPSRTTLQQESSTGRPRARTSLTG